MMVNTKSSIATPTCTEQCLAKTRCEARHKKRQRVAVVVAGADDPLQGSERLPTNSAAAL